MTIITYHLWIRFDSRGMVDGWHPYPMTTWAFSDRTR